MVKKYRTNKLYKISVLTLLVLILVSLIVIISMISPINLMYGDDYYIEIGPDELNSLGINVIDRGMIHYSEDYYTFEEFGRYANKQISSFDDFLDYATEKGYELSYDDDFFVEFISEENCTFDSIRQKEICLVSTLIIDKTTKTIILNIESIPNFAEDIYNEDE